MTSEELDRLAELERKATAGPWRSMRAGNQYVKTRYMPTAECVGASEINEIPRPWNPHAMVAFMKLDAAETSRFKDDDGDFLAEIRNSAPALIALAREALAARKIIGTTCGHRMCSPNEAKMYEHIRTANEAIEKP